MSQPSRVAVNLAPIQALVFAGLTISGIAFAMASLLVASEALPVSVSTALTTDTSESWLEHMAPSGAVRGVQLGLLAFLFGGVPAAVGAATMTRWLRGTTSSRWEAIVRAALVFQLGCLLLTGLVFGYTCFAIIDMPEMAREILPFSMTLVLSAVASGWAVRCWHQLGQELQQGPRVESAG